MTWRKSIDCVSSIVCRTVAVAHGRRAVPIVVAGSGGGTGRCSPADRSAPASAPRSAARCPGRRTGRTSGARTYFARQPDPEPGQADQGGQRGPRRRGGSTSRPGRAGSRPARADRPPSSARGGPAAGGPGCGGCAIRASRRLGLTYASRLTLARLLGTVPEHVDLNRTSGHTSVRETHQFLPARRLVRFTHLSRLYDLFPFPQNPFRRDHRQEQRRAPARCSRAGSAGRCRAALSAAWAGRRAASPSVSGCRTCRRSSVAARIELGLVHLDPFHLAGGGLDAERGRRDRRLRAPAAGAGGPRSRPRPPAAAPPRTGCGCRARPSAPASASRAPSARPGR